MSNQASPASHHMRLYAGGITLSVLLAVYYWHAASLAAFVQKALPASMGLCSPMIRATVGLTVPGLIVGTVLCLIWPLVRANLASAPRDESAVLAAFLHARRPTSSSAYMAIVITLICAYNLFLLTPPDSLLDYGTNLMNVLYPLISKWGLVMFAIVGVIWDRWAARQFKSAIVLLTLVLALLFFSPVILSIAPLLAYSHDTIPYELTYLILSKVPLVIGMAIITDLFRRIDTNTGYFGVALSSIVVMLLSSSLLTTNAIAMLVCCGIFGTLRAAGVSLRIMLGLHVLSQVSAYLIFKGGYLLHYMPTNLPHPFAYY
ncbi:hypothetical protein [Zymobacter sp. IVIA_5232.4 C2]|uniref:hypothetical protein n=1 Tax=Zymobacter sp. IVIA_5232.4 C2 TaxID=3394855 RepID=UPI0039C2CA3F